MTSKCRPTLLVGSVPLETTSDVLHTAGTILGETLRSIPDGETGVRIQWYSWQEAVFERATFLDKGSVDAFGYHRFTAREDLADAAFGELGYAEAAIASFREFVRLRDAGSIALATRFQVSLPTPMAPLATMIGPDSYARIEPLYEAAMAAEVRAICAAIPAKDLAIQWDLAQEIAVLEGLAMLDGRQMFARPQEDVLERVVRVASWVPDDVATGFHLCYGDTEHKHWMEPRDTRVMVDFANAIFASVPRRIDWLHMPVPRDRDDDAYFAPLTDLRLPAATQLYLGLVHHTDGEDGGRRRIATASRHVADFGVATECGLGRRPAETIPTVLTLMRRLTAD